MLNLRGFCYSDATSIPARCKHKMHLTSTGKSKKEKNMNMRRDTHTNLT